MCDYITLYFFSCNVKPKSPRKCDNAENICTKERSYTYRIAYVIKPTFLKNLLCSFSDNDDSKIV